ncbi:type II secretory ATPase GspE/PulE/Tfp pilus assembly ATPase PilB-like protein [Haloferula luteola]|uniref:Type II secretory ATPase GspE/PulE/Tfp pilus assembly ATPase PilB-like protein n=1 Tax=Haloferula luteola TaxID=595692 RepID=A0A840V2T5_9BACT|nr:GspE/PulE family protein [Haloferula luteola]MBB5352305.1 type II secretory ATPase GspE/PulE/Tfp pilus assembly ATPase PilB-like protein [Haloferula luteola]
MTELLIEPAKKSGCDELKKLEEVLESAALRQRSPIDDLLDAGLVDEEPYMRELASELGMEWLPSIPQPEAPLPLREACGPRVALRHRLLPIEVVGSEEAPVLKLATFDPFNLVARQEVAREIEMPVEWVMASRRRIHEALRRLYGVGADTFEQILEGRDMDFSNLEVADEANVIDADDDAEASVVKFVNQIIRESLDQKATDIHVEPLADNLRIRYRIDGRLVEVTVPENIKALQSSVIARLKIMSRLDIAERRLPQDGRINLEFQGQTIDVRVATVPTVEGESVSLRLLNQQKFNVDRLGMESFVRKRIESLLKLPNGIILITGPTGSGKSTSLYSFLSEINSPDQRIVTIEDPVENKLPGVMQIAVKSDIGLTFAAGLRSILRADPNTVMIGEIRDLETAEIAIRASLTGHLVFSTLHTNDALGGISRLTDMGVEPFLVSAAVRAFLAQRLVRKLCDHCKVPREVTQQDRLDLGIPLEITGQAYDAVGCDRCRDTGFQGRLAIYEVVVIGGVMQDLIAHGAPAAEIKAQALKDGYIPMRGYGWHKVLQGLTTIEEVISVTATDAGGA